MGMFGMFGKKEGGFDAATGEWGSDNVGMMKMLAGMPHMMRKPMMKGRINQLLSLTEEKRQESIRDMIGAFHSSKVKLGARESLVATRVALLFGENLHEYLSIGRLTEKVSQGDMPAEFGLGILERR